MWPEEGYGTAAARSVVLMAELSAVTTRPELPRHHTLTLGSLTPFFICGYGYPRLVFQEPGSTVTMPPQASKGQDQKIPGRVGIHLGHCVSLLSFSLPSLFP